MRHPIVAKAERAAEWRDHLRERCHPRGHKPGRKQVVLVGQVITAVCEYFGLTPDQLRSKTREREIVQARQIGMYLARRMTDRSRPAIGAAFGGFDNTTVIHAERKVEALMQVNPEVQTDVDKIAGATLSGW